MEKPIPPRAPQGKGLGNGRLKRGEKASLEYAERQHSPEVAEGKGSGIFCASAKTLA